MVWVNIAHSESNMDLTRGLNQGLPLTYSTERMGACITAQCSGTMSSSVLQQSLVGLWVVVRHVVVWYAD